MRAPRPVLLLLAASSMLAGCALEPRDVDGPPSDALPPPEAEWRVAPRACPEPTIQKLTPNTVAPAPEWSVGDWWNYTLVDDEDVERGYASYEVLGCADVGTRIVYRVRERVQEWGREVAYPEAPNERIVMYDTATLNEVWAACGEPYIMGDCQGVRRQWDFPLTPGKSWSDQCCGDVVSSVGQRVVQADEDHWWIIVEAPNDALVANWTYSRSLGLFTNMTGSWWNGPGSWELREHGNGAPPEMAPSFETQLEMAPGCLHPEARGASASAPLLPAWQSSPQGAIVRLSRALGDPLVGRPYLQGSEKERLIWNGTNGTFETWARPPPGLYPGVTWRAPPGALGPMGEAKAGAWLARTIDRFAFDDAARLDIATDTEPGIGWRVEWIQRVDGRRLMEIGGAASWSEYGIELAWGAAHALPANATVPASEARDIATAYMRCAMDAMGRTEAEGYAFQQAGEPDLAVRAGTLVHAVLAHYTEPPPHSHCGEAWRVHVDALTGAVVGHERPICY